MSRATVRAAMSDAPRDRAAAQPPATLGEGCVRRYDPEALTEEDGADFAEAAELWQRLQREQEPAGEK